MAFSVSTSDIEALWRPLDSEESDVAFQRLEQAQRRLRILRPTLEATIAATAVGTAKDDLVGTVRDVLCDVVIRYLQNPDRYRSQNIDASGGVGIGFDVGGREAQGGIYFSDNDLASIDAAVAVATGMPATAVMSRVLQTSFPYYRPTDNGLPVVN
jgi:hypothetical protein